MLVDRSAPAARFPAAPLDEVLEALQITLDLALHEAERIPKALLEPLRLVAHLKRHPGRVLVDIVERHDTGILIPRDAVPGDALIGDLLNDPRLPLLLSAADFGAPLQVLVVDLPHLLDALHEARELLKLGPLVVRRADRNVDFDRLRNGRHGHFPR